MINLSANYCPLSYLQNLGSKFAIIANIDNDLIFAPHAIYLRILPSQQLQVKFAICANLRKNIKFASNLH
jgi:hypothetical protein